MEILLDEPVPEKASSDTTPAINLSSWKDYWQVSPPDELTLKLPLSHKDLVTFTTIHNREIPAVVHSARGTYNPIPMFYLPKYEREYCYNPNYEFYDSDLIARMKLKGVNQIQHHPFHIQDRITQSNWDRWQYTFGPLFGLDKDGKVCHYSSVTGKLYRHKLFAATQMPYSRKMNTTVDGKFYGYHLYSLLPPLPSDGYKKRRVATGMQRWLVEDDNQYTDDLIRYAVFFLKSTLITYYLRPDLIIYLKSSKNLISRIVSAILQDSYFTDTQILEVAKPEPQQILDYYRQSGYQSEYFDNFSGDDIKMRDLGRGDRHFYGDALYHCYQLDTTHHYKFALVIDDLVTTGTTISRFLVPVATKLADRFLPLTLFARR